MAFLQKKEVKRELKDGQIHNRRYVLSLYAKIDGAQLVDKKNLLEDMKRVLRALCPSVKSEKRLKNHEIVFKQKGTSTTGGAGMPITIGERRLRAWCELGSKEKGIVVCGDEYHLVNYSRPLPQHSHSAFVRSFDSSLVGEGFESFLQFLGYEFEYEYVADGTIFYLTDTIEIQMYQVLKVEHGGFRTWKGGKNALQTKPAWNRPWWIVEIRATCDDASKLQASETLIEKFATCLKDYGVFYANVHRATL
mmetsp:Transcript_955/g.1347  ORF Transcript_955/g.1347 Transcript_955/m.1347 type:complete len:250 (+) Transcript_955:76-825(+)|eukprot:CAMPEP_0167740434 /NCGR_PEP_ID=MMETSP0110_2-20121227/274_1 /TAXON_ID=629695 /ORGANISM="Gymnochlora sp., Strain CCMP2014" /LENGTH=249 /DNA_ID=CAMNT_0007624325 /DNA_START=40 /DNA_END=789 /DNA_ORIENTATION=+